MPSTVPRDALREAAASTAGHDILVALFPANAPGFDTLNDAVLRTIADGHRKSAGIKWGAAVARYVLTARAGDGFDATVAPPHDRTRHVAPDYVSGHSTFSGAAAAVLARFWGSDSVAFTAGSDFLPGVLRHFSSFSAAADEAGMSRICGGIHYHSANEDGKKAGAEVGMWTFDHYLRPKGNRSR